MHCESGVRRSFRLGMMVGSSVLLVVPSMRGQDSNAQSQSSANLRATHSEAHLGAQLRAQELEIEILKDRINGLEVALGTLKSRSGITINPTDGAVPIRASAKSFSDSPLSVDANGNLEIGANPAPDSANGGLTMIGSLGVSHILEVHNNYAVGIDLYTHSDEEFRAPYINLFKTRGTQTAPTPAMFTGYELDSIGGINFGGWDGSAYYAAAAVYTQTDENWDDTHHGGHISIYGTNPGGHTQQLAQFGGVDSDSNPYVGNIIFQRPLTWGSNSAADVGLFPVGSEKTLKVRTADDSADANLTAGSLVESISHTPSSAIDICTSGQIAWDETFIYVCVAPNTWKRGAISSW